MPTVAVPRGNRGKRRAVVDIIHTYQNLSSTGDPRCRNSHAGYFYYPPTVHTHPELDPEVSGPPNFGVTTGTEAVYTVRLRNTGDGYSPRGPMRITFYPGTMNFVRLEQITFQACIPEAPPANLNSGRLINCTSDSGIAPGGEAGVRIVLTPNSLMPNGEQFLLMNVHADPLNIVSERNESNNIVSIMATLAAPSDLQIIGNEPIQTVEYKDILHMALWDPTYIYVRALLKVKNAGPSQSPPTKAKVNWVNGFDPAPGCPGTSHLLIEHGVPGCVADSRGVPNDFLVEANVPTLVPGASIDLIAAAAIRKDRFDNCSGYYGFVSLDPNRVVPLDSNRSNNLWQIRR